MSEGGRASPAEEGQAGFVWMLISCAYTHRGTCTHIHALNHFWSLWVFRTGPAWDWWSSSVCRKEGETDSNASVRRLVLQAQRLGTSRHGSAGRRVVLQWEMGRMGPETSAGPGHQGGNVGLHPDSRAFEGFEQESDLWVI